MDHYTHNITQLHIIILLIDNYMVLLMPTLTTTSTYGPITRVIVIFIDLLMVVIPHVIRTVVQVEVHVVREVIVSEIETRMIKIKTKTKVSHLMAWLIMMVPMHPLP